MNQAESSEAKEFLERLLSVLTESERQRFVSDLDVAVQGQGRELVDSINDTLDRWAATVTVRSHPQFAVDVKDFKDMIASGSAFEKVST